VIGDPDGACDALIGSGLEGSNAVTTTKDH
jgi:hypothetical protein